MAGLVTLVMSDQTLTGDPAMHAITVVQKLWRRSIPSLHLKRLNTLTDIVGSALRGGRPQDPAPRLQAPTVGRAAASKIAMRRYSLLIGK